MNKLILAAIFFHNYIILSLLIRDLLARKPTATTCSFLSLLPVLKIRKANYCVIIVEIFSNTKKGFVCVAQ